MDSVGPGGMLLPDLGAGLRPVLRGVEFSRTGGGEVVSKLLRRAATPCVRVRVCVTVCECVCVYVGG